MTTNSGVKSSISHKEALTFNNLTNLEWQFVELYNQTTGKRKNNLFLNDLLKPELFVETDEYGEVIEYKYGGLDEEGNYKKEEGIVELRQNAGIAMEYLEKWEDEGLEEARFMQDWEVIYAADNYKVVTDYLDDTYDRIQKKLNLNSNNKPKLYPTRQELEDVEKLQRRVEIGYKVFDGVLDIALNWGDLAKSSIDLSDKIVKEVSQKALKGLAKELDDNIILQLLTLGYLSRDDLKKVCQELGKIGGKAYMDLKEEDKFVDELEEILKNSSVLITEELNLDDTGFRVVAFKKGEDIVIAYKGHKTTDSQLLPEEKDYLQIVFNKIKRDNKDAKRIKFTGYEGGAELGFINTLNISLDQDSLNKKQTIDRITATLFYNKIEEVKGLIDFTPEDLHKNYKSNIKIMIKSSVKDIPNGLAKKTFLLVVTTGLMTYFGKTIALGVIGSNILLILVGVIASTGIDFLITWFGSEKVKEIYDLLIDLKLIEPKQSGIKGYVTDKYINQNYIEIKIDEGEEIKIKKEHAIFLIFNHVKNNNFKNITESITKYGNLEYKIKNEITASTVTSRSATSNTEYWKLEKINGEIYEITEVIEEKTSVSRSVNTSIINMSLSSEHKKEITKGIMSANLIQVLGIMQRNYKEKKQDAFEFIYTTREGISLSNEITQAIKENIPISNSDLANEFVFMPYLDAKGNINEEKPKLREEYIASVLKSSIIYNYLKKSRSKTRGYGFEHALNNLKYKKEELEEIGHDFEGREVNKEFIKIMHELQYGSGEVQSHSSRDISNCKISPYHYKNILEMLRNDKGLLENLYEEKEIKEVNPRAAYQFINNELDGMVIINSNNKLEYKYNPHDYIIGGKLTLYALNLSQAVKERDETPFKRIPQEEFMNVLEINEMIKNNSGEIIDFEDLDIEVPKEDLYDDNIDILIEKLNNSSNINRSSKTNTEILAEEFGLK
ncbi:MULTISPECIES: hypothetical protein [unclassified Candidatus Frackibacter]|uniref:hypothetical protein n=1 Tax=unclassified Candidatus Frackibacter TaxID=2648818 RepID=UPI00079BF3CC|nr:MULTISPECIES: hypothetical protein [unclassified Candidatus Frackibacter]KXS40090.1 MAG: hypothetical protein AWU54_2100 [Candidatus Frackibacter sp. T328-2]SDC16589.1 hypothetical protein SAMN04515661_10361 [Candidatus Frackibacter sp. WG11]SEM45141.1 hypothetical protein SAMN04488698_10481 [Candidatus Frackibacter sp. WG12]SFL47502.1 hypothetical protein SAMN04488699_10379 [Candidatus Frackibacter sp. WG13]